MPSVIKKIVKLIHENNFNENSNLVACAALENSANIELLFNLGLSCAQAGKANEALVIFNQLIRFKPDDSKIFYNIGLLHSIKGNLDFALSAYKKSLEQNPNDIESLTNMGGVLNDLHLYSEALEVLEKAIKVNSSLSETWSNLGIALNNLRLHSKAVEAYDQAIKITPKSFEVWSNRATALQNLGNFKDALTSCEHSIMLNANYARAWLNKGYILDSLKSHDEALDAYRKAISIQPRFAEPWFSIGVTLNHLKLYDEALTAYDEAINLRPDYAEAWNDRGCVLQELFQTNQALDSYQKALAIKPEYIDALYNQGVALQELLYPVEALKSFHRVLKLEPEHVQARWALTLCSIPPMLSSNGNIREIRKNFSDALEDLRVWFDEHKLDSTVVGAGSHQPFYLAYQEENNKGLLSKYGAICYKSMKHWQDINKLHIQPRQPKPDEKIKIGIVSDHIRNHSVWHALVKGWVENLNPDRFEIHIFCLNSMIDSETDLAKLKSATFTQNQPTLIDWTRSIIEKGLDILIYPEIGMNEYATQLASLRIAPLQLASWGHPETTGLPTIDYYISATAFEPKNSENYYSEKLIKLPHLGSCYTKKNVAPAIINLETLGIKKSSPLLLCPGTPFKYSPSTDWVFVKIAKSLVNCQFIFFYR